jgi:phosphoribosyl 1,2-cyclic phosphodiesterase
MSAPAFMGMNMLIKFWGVHGSLPRPGPTTLKYGGNTPCVEVRGRRSLIIFDAGSGIRDLGDDLLKRTANSRRGSAKITAHIFFSHLHWDHVQGFPFFAPAYVNGNAFHLYGIKQSGSGVERVMRNQMSKPYFPVELEDMEADLTFYDLEAGEVVKIDDSIITTLGLNHPGGSLAYRVDQDGRSVIYATDTENVKSLDKSLLEFACDVDVLIFDNMFTPDQYRGESDNLSRRGWGHSTWESAVKFAKEANVGKLVLFHHGNHDAQVERIEAEAKELFPRAMAAYEGLEIEI